ncbi:MAG: helix-turn-helix domain-containing protein, partial [Litoreibacter sp.]
MPDQDEESISRVAAKEKTGASRQKPMRAASEKRARDIVAAAAEHFSEVGFGGSTREIAKRVGVTQPLLYRYFPTKGDLIEAVYRTVYLERWDQSWDVA